MNCTSPSRLDDCRIGEYLPALQEIADHQRSDKAERPRGRNRAGSDFDVPAAYRLTDCFGIGLGVDERVGRAKLLLTYLPRLKTRDAQRLNRLEICFLNRVAV